MTHPELIEHIRRVGVFFTTRHFLAWLEHCRSPTGRINCVMLFDRQRVLLELLDALNEPVSSIDFQKLLFLYTREGEPAPSYEFVPYRFGCFCSRPTPTSAAWWKRN